MLFRICCVSILLAFPATADIPVDSDGEISCFTIIQYQSKKLAKKLWGECVASKIAMCHDIKGDYERNGPALHSKLVRPTDDPTCNYYSGEVWFNADTSIGQTNVAPFSLRIGYTLQDPNTSENANVRRVEIRLADSRDKSPYTSFTFFDAYPPLVNGYGPSVMMKPGDHFSVAIYNPIQQGLVVDKLHGDDVITGVVARCKRK